jgi:nucleoside-triphosphatase THEP1
MVLDSLLSIDDTPAHLFFITGESGVGKTTWCKEQIQVQRSAGKRIAGLISPPVFRQGQKIGIDLLDLSSGDSRPLAHARKKMKPYAATKKWIMHPETIRWGNRLLSSIDSCDLLFLDELGPLEFLHNQGLTEAFPLINRQAYRVAIIVVRPSLLKEATNRWSHLPAIVHSLD